MNDIDIERLSPYGRYLFHCERGELAFQRGEDGQAFFYPRYLTPGTGDEPQWQVSSGLGRVYSVTLVHHRNEDPFALVLVDLDEGFRMMSRVDTDAPETVAIGARVAVDFRSLGEGQPILPVFRLVEDAR